MNMRWWLLIPCTSLAFLLPLAFPLLIHWTDVACHLDKEDYLLIELPEYKMPDMRTVGIYVSDKVKGYLQKAGTIIFLGTIVIWGLLNFGPQGYGREDPTQSLGALLGHSWCLFCSYWTGILADYGGPSCRNFSKRSGCIKLCCSFWNHQCNKRRGHGPVSAGS